MNIFDFAFLVVVEMVVLLSEEAESVATVSAGVVVLLVAVALLGLPLLSFSSLPLPC